MVADETLTNKAHHFAMAADDGIPVAAIRLVTTDTDRSARAPAEVGAIALAAAAAPDRATNDVSWRIVTDWNLRTLRSSNR